MDTLVEIGVDSQFTQNSEWIPRYVWLARTCLVIIFS